MLAPLSRWIGRALVCAAFAASPVVLGQAKQFSNEQLDQMLAQIALYPDSLLSQVLMASTYPAEFQEAYQWSKAHPDDKGDEAVTKVQNQSWDTSVMSLVAFPEVLITLGEKPDYVKNLGDAFLAQPEDVMDSVQRLRAAAQKAGNLKSNEQIKVSTEPAPPPAAPAPAPAQASTTTVVQAPPVTQTIVIQPAQPSTIYVPAYNPAVVYGTWWWPAYPPYYYPPPPGYWFSRGVGAAVSWGVGFAVGSALWGGFNWHDRDVNIDIDRHNNINVNKQINVDARKTNWSHNSEHRKNVAYRGGDAEKQRLDQKRATTSREQYRGKGDAADRSASRERAQQTMQGRGVESPQGSARDRAQSIDRDEARARAQGGQGNLAQSRQQGGGGQSVDRDAARQRAQSADRDAARQRAQSASHDNAFKSVNSSNARAQQARGASSNASAQHMRAGGGGGGGGAHRGGGGGGGHGRR